MSLSNLQEKLFQIEGFQKRLDQLVIFSATAQMPFLTSQKVSNEVIDWDYMLLCASLLAQTTNGAHQTAALRIAQSCLTIGPSDRHSAAGVVLDQLTNRPAIDLALKRELLTKEFQFSLPTPLSRDWIKREAAYSLKTSGGKIVHINKFQREFIDHQDAQWISLSAPTSSGKSFILLEWVTEFVARNIGCVVIYLVPTRALIQQVELDFKQQLKGRSGIHVSSVPSDSIRGSVATIFVFTQERLSYSLISKSLERIEVLIVDEAQKVSDNTRGVLLQQVIEECARRFKDMKVMFLSPMTSNPESLLLDAPESVSKYPLRSEQVTVTQQLIWVSQIKRKPKDWQVELCVRKQRVVLGTIELKSSPSVGQRLPFVSFSMRNDGGNLIYVNGAAEAEKVAQQIWSLLGATEDCSSDVDIKNLILLVKTYIHNNYGLAEVLSRGVAFHYGNMPLLIRSEIERLFKIEKLKFIVCTSTLIEGVNLPAKSIFLRGPKKGKNTPLTEVDFWNLAGRAGRLGMEFEGMIVCVDATDASVWKKPPPTERVKYSIQRSSDEIVNSAKELIDFIEQGTPRKIAVEKPQLEYVFVYLLNHFNRYKSLQESPLSKRIDKVVLTVLNETFERLPKYGDITPEIIERNAGISPFAMQSLLKAFTAFGEKVTEVIPVPPESNDALTTYQNVIRLINIHLSGEPDHKGYIFVRALLVCQWMQGYPLARIIAERLKFKKGKSVYTGATVNVQPVIRETMSDIEEYARFRFPKYVSCYIDILAIHLQRIGRADVIEDIPDLKIWLEFGAFKKTHLSLMAIGLSRLSSIKIADYITEDELDESGCLKWLREKNLETLDLSPIIIEEVQRVIGSHE